MNYLDQLFKLKVTPKGRGAEVNRIEVQNSGLCSTLIKIKAICAGLQNLPVILFWILKLIFWLIWVPACILATFLGLVSLQWSGAGVVSVFWLSEVFLAFYGLVDLTVAQRVDSSRCRLSVWLFSSGIRCSVGSSVFCWLHLPGLW